MSAAGAIRAGRAFVELFADDGPLMRGLQQASAKFKGWAAGLTAQGSKLIDSGKMFAGLSAGFAPMALQATHAAVMLDMVGGRAAGAMSPLMHSFSSFALSLHSANEGLRRSAEGILLLRAGSATVAALSAGAKLLQAGFTASSLAVSALVAGVGLLLSPVGLVVAGIVGLTAAWLKFTDSGGAALKWLTENLGEWKDFALETFQGIADALSAGDISLAIKILSSTLKVAWESAVIFMLEKWGNFKNEVNHIAIDAFYGILETANNVWASMRQGWADFVNWFTNVWKGAQEKIAEGMIDIMAFFDDSINAADAKGILQEDAQRDKQRREAEHKQKTKQIEGERAAREEDLAQQNISANAGLDSDAAGELAERQRALDEHKKTLRNARDDRQKAIKAANNKAVTHPVLANRQAAIAAQDVRTKEGFAPIAALFRNGNDPNLQLVQLAQKGAQVQDQIKRYNKRTADAIEKVTVKNFSK
jgi:hypothetical protein